MSLRFVRFMGGRFALIVVAAAVAQGCFYDSRWGEAKRAQKHAASEALPKAIQARGLEGRASTANRVKDVHVRAFASRAYRSQVFNWHSQFDDLIADANKVLVKDLQIRLVVDAREPWDLPQQTEANLDEALDALNARAATPDGALAIGLVGNVSLVSAQFHDLGMAESPGRALVLRAPARAADHDAIEREFDELSEDERANLRRVRRRHRAAAILLHEIGHTLGATHAASRESLMNPTYDVAMSTFDDASLDEMRAGTSGNRNASMLPPPAPRSTEVITSSPATTSSPQALRQEDQRVYRQAMEAFKAAHVDEAWMLASRLFKAYPDHPDVQDLHCQLAVVRRASDFAEICTRAEKVMGRAEELSGRRTWAPCHNGDGY